MVSIQYVSDTLLGIGHPTATPMPMTWPLRQTLTISPQLGVLPLIAHLSSFLVRVAYIVDAIHAVTVPIDLRVLATSH